MLDGTDDAVALFGFSSGASIALAAAAAGLPVSKLALFEVPLDPEGGSEGAVFLSELRERIAAGDRAGTLEVYMADMPPEVLEGAKQSPAWPTMLEVAPSLEADAESLAWTQSAPRAELWRGISAPTLVMVGEQTHADHDLGSGIRRRIDAERAVTRGSRGESRVRAALDGPRHRGVPGRLNPAVPSLRRRSARRAAPQEVTETRDRLGADVLTRTTSSGTVGGGISRSSSPSTASTPAIASRPSASKS